MNGTNDGTVQRRVEFAPFPRRYHRPGSQAHRLKHATDDHRIGGKHLPQQGNCRLVCAPGARRLHRSGQDFLARKLEHRTRQYVLGLGMGGYAKAWHIDADDANAIDFLG